MKTLQTQNSIDHLADLTWALLNHLCLDLDFDAKKTKQRPPVFRFLSKESKNSLRGRNSEEVELVHRQQASGEGITLLKNPTAWVSYWYQVPEETAHLFALLHRKTRVSLLNSKIFSSKDIHSLMSLHEALGKFAEILVLGFSEDLRKSLSRLQKLRVPKLLKAVDEEQIWKSAHQFGYQVGTRLAAAYFSERLSISEIIRWTQMPWAKNPSAALQFALTLSDVDRKQLYRL